VADGRHDRLGQDLEGADLPDVAGGVRKLRQSGDHVDDADDQAREHADPLPHDGPAYETVLSEG